MREVPAFIVEHVCLHTLFLDKSSERGAFSERLRNCSDFVENYLGSISKGFVSTQSNEFVEQLENVCGKVMFTSKFAIRIRPEGYRLFVSGKEIFDYSLIPTGLPVGLSDNPE